MLGLALGLAFTGGQAASAQDVPAPPVPTPPERPAELTPPPPVPASPGTVPAPPARDAATPPDGAAKPPADPAGKSDEAGPPAPSLPNVKVTAEMACQERLARLDVAFKPRPPIREGQCAIESPVDVSSLGRDLALQPVATLNCSAAEAAARWMREVVAPAAETHLKAKTTGIGQASAYVCRNRNHAATGKISEHAFGNAIDIATIVFGGRKPLPIKADESAPSDEKAFLAEIRRGACSYFDTVLGPGADPEHADHMHLDLRERPNGYRICE